MSTSTPTPTPTPSLSLSLSLSRSLPLPPLSSSLLSHDAADYSIDLFKGLHFMIMNFTVPGPYVSCTTTQLHHLPLLLFPLPYVIHSSFITPTADVTALLQEQHHRLDAQNSANLQKPTSES